MQTNFFTLITQMGISGTLNLVIAQTGNGQLVVSVLLNNGQNTGKDKLSIPALNLKASAQELDAAFFDTVSEPIVQTVSLLQSQERYLQNLADAKSKCKADTTDKPVPARTPKEKKYSEMMEQSKKLEAEGKFKEAWTKLPDPLEYPEQGEIIRNKRQALSEKFAPDLFAAFEPAPQPATIAIEEPIIEEPGQEEEQSDDLDYNEYSGLETDDDTPFEI